MNYEEYVIFFAGSERYNNGIKYKEREENGKSRLNPAGKRSSCSCRWKRKHCQRDQLYDETALCAEGR